MMPIVSLLTHVKRTPNGLRLVPTGILGQCNSSQSLEGTKVPATTTNARTITSSSAVAASPFTQALMSVISPDKGPKQSFSATSSASNDAREKLLDILSREEKEEQESGNLEMPTELADLKSVVENDWRIVDDDNDSNAVTHLFLKGEQKVQLSFHCQDTVEGESLSTFFDDEDGHDDESAGIVGFTVTIAKAGKALVFKCVSDEGRAKIQGVATTTTTPESIHAGLGVWDKVGYQGPEFEELAEDLQETMEAYLEEACMVDSNVATFVSMYSDYKEQTQYVKFLQDAQSVIR